MTTCTLNNWLKPPLYFSKGYWCVNPKPKPYHLYLVAWNLAHNRKMELNYRRREGK